MLEEIRVAGEKGKPMVPVFQETFSERAGDKVKPHVETLLTHNGVHLLDRRNIHIDHTITDLAEIVKQTVAEEAA